MVLPIEGEMPKGRGGLDFMKKNYIAPSIEVVNIEAVEMLAASIRIDRTGQSGDQQLGNERGEDRQWGNIWAD